jgi:predicted TIM-barrel fold metal-dependent hydrolase
MIYAGPLIDAHHHLWDLSLGKHPWLREAKRDEMVFGDPTPLMRNYLPLDFRADAERQNLVASVHVEAGWDPADPVGETRWLDDQAAQHGLPTVFVVHAPLHKPEAESVLRAQRRFDRVRGVRFILSWHSDSRKNFAARPDYIEDSAWLAGFALLRRFDLSFDLMLYPGQMEQAARLAERFPDTSIIVNHAGSPADRARSDIEHWRRGLKLLAAKPNVAIKISDLVAYDHDWTVDSLRPVVLACIEAFGTERAMFASDFPVAGLHATYDQVFDAFKAIVADFSAREQRRLFHDNAARLYRIVV